MTIFRSDANGPVQAAKEVEATQFVSLFMERLVSAPRTSSSSR
jgi:hypothetical protein